MHTWLVILIPGSPLRDPCCLTIILRRMKNCKKSTMLSQTLSIWVSQIRTTYLRQGRKANGLGRRINSRLRVDSSGVTSLSRTGRGKYPSSLREYIFRTGTDSASFAPEIKKGPFPRPVPLPAVLLQPSRMSLLVHILLHLMVINPLSSTTLAGLKLKPKLLLQLIYHHLLLSRVFLLIRKLLLIYEEEYVSVLLISLGQCCLYWFSNEGTHSISISS